MEDGYTLAPGAFTDIYVPDFAKLCEEYRAGTCKTFGTVQGPIVCILQFAFVLDVYPNGDYFYGDPRCDGGWIGIFLRRVDWWNEEATPTLVFELKILTKAGHQEDILCERTGVKSFTVGGNCGYHRMLAATEAVAKSRDIIIRVTLTYRRDDKPRLVHTPAMNALIAMRESGSNCDVTLQVKPGSELQVHRAVLASNSPVFKAMFDSRMAEARNMTVAIPDLELQVVQALVDYMYQGTYPRVDATSLREAGDLLMAGTKYQVFGFVSYIEDTLQQSMTEANVCEMLITADRTGAMNLRRQGIRYIVEDSDRFQAVQDTLGFDALGEDLVTELLANFFRRYKRSRTCDTEFPEGSDWQRLSKSQLRRACAERGLPDGGSRENLLAALGCPETKPLS